MHSNLTTTLGIISHLEDMDVGNSSYLFYKYQREVLDEQKVLAEESRREHISGRTDPSVLLRLGRLDVS